MKTTKLALLLALPALLLAPATAPAVPAKFFGIAPQTALGDTDTAYMKAARIGSVRWPVNWATVQPTPGGAYDWSSVDAGVDAARRRGLHVLPFLYGVPSWISPKPTKLPIDNARARNAWKAFVRAAVQRYAARGVHTYQVWNEANFFYFAFPVSTGRYARLLKLTKPVIERADRRAEIVLSGLFGDPDEGGRRGMDAADFLAGLYRVRGIARYFDAVALHPYAFRVADLKELVEEMRRVVVANRDRGARMYVTEMGWGSENNVRKVAFEQGIKGQVRQLRGAYRYLLRKRGKLNLKGAYWFSWKDVQGDCNFCDSVGLFREGIGFSPKPAWKALVAITGGRARP